jgi:hypothetical protein
VGGEGREGGRERGERKEGKRERKRRRIGQKPISFMHIHLKSKK